MNDIGQVMLALVLVLVMIATLLGIITFLLGAMEADEFEHYDTSLAARYKRATWTYKIGYELFRQRD